MARGGKNYPREPAPTSGPGRLARRTDGGAGSESQPIRVAPGQGYGVAKAAAEQQQGAPMAAGASTPAPGATSSSPARVGVPPPGAGDLGLGAFGPTQRPAESPLAGMVTRNNAVAQDLDMFLQILYSRFQHPGIGMLLRKDM